MYESMLAMLTREVHQRAQSSMLLHLPFGRQGIVDCQQDYGAVIERKELSLALHDEKKGGHQGFVVYH
jgi:hypothetical protein